MTMTMTTRSCLLILLLDQLFVGLDGFLVAQPQKFRLSQLRLSDWSGFQALDDDEDLDVDMNTYAKEEDSQDYKAQIGSSLEPPSIERGAEPIFVPQGSVLDLTEENILGLLAACREEIGTMFGYSEENRGVGITGGVDYVDLDGPTIILRLKGRFWHERTTVLARVGAYLMGRIPEIVDVVIEDEWQLTNEANDAW